MNDHDAELAYKKGFLDGITAYAWWRDGVQQVGTTGMILNDATTTVEATWNYQPGFYTKENEK